MNLPLYPYELISSTTHLILALIIGGLFGFVLERGGLGSAKKLIGQFTLTDMTVFKVMFTAIVTCMFGLFLFNRLGFINLDLISFNDSYLLPQALGGFLLGIGFVVAGYCPGTSIVAMATAKLDALICFGGLFLGTWLFILFFGEIEFFYNSSHLSADKLSDILSMNPVVVMFLISFIAIACFYFCEKLEAQHE